MVLSVDDVEVGMHVRLQGLSLEEWNGTVGVVEKDADARERGRIAVRLDENGVFSFKPENCTICYSKVAGRCGSPLDATTPLQCAEGETE